MKRNELQLGKRNIPKNIWLCMGTGFAAIYFSYDSCYIYIYISVSTILSKGNEQKTKRSGQEDWGRA